jgi:gas vesicle protein
MTAGKVFLGVLAGVVAGTLLGVAIAPRKSRSQKFLNRKSEELADALNSTIDKRFEELLNQVEDRFERRREKAI